jgi:hypothetical protein
MKAREAGAERVKITPSDSAMAMASARPMATPVSVKPSARTAGRFLEDGLPRGPGPGATKGGTSKSRDGPGPERDEDGDTQRRCGR